MNILYPVLNGNVSDIQHGLGDALSELSNNGLQPKYLWITSMFKRQGEIKPDEHILKHLLKKYDVSVLDTDVFLRSMNYDGISLSDAIRVNIIETPWVSFDTLLRQSILYLHASKQFLKENDINVVVFLMGRGLFQRCLGLMARHMGIRTLYLCDAFIPGKTVHIWESETDACSDLRGIPLKKLSAEEQKEIDVFKAEQKKVKVITSSPYDAGSLRRKMRSFFIHLFSDDRIFGNRSAFSQVWYEMLRKVRTILAKHFYSSVFPDKYILLPYQVYYDLLLPLMYPEYTNIEYLTKQCAEALPLGYALVVKEHPHFKGGTSLGELQRISQMKNVLIAPVDMDINRLLEKSSGVITVCSNVGWQAMLYDKPVVVLNNTVSDSFCFHYADYEITFNAELYSLRSVIAQALNTKIPSGFYEPFLFHVVLDRYKGSPRLCPVDYNNIIYGDNISVVSKYLYNKLKGEQ